MTGMGGTRRNGMDLDGAGLNGPGSSGAGPVGTGPVGSGRVGSGQVGIGAAGARSGRHMVRGMALAVMAALAGCGNQSDEGPSGLSMARQALGQVVGGIGGEGQDDAAPAPADNPETMAARALAANPAPLIFAQMENPPVPQVLAQVGQNGAMRTYMTPNRQALILRDGLLVGTRGLGHDLAVAEPGALAGLIHARRAGSGQRVMRYLSGDGVERPLPLTCTTTPGETQSFAFAGRDWQARQVHESCTGQGISIHNSYLVTADGQIPVSHQWVGPELGHVTLQVIRP